MTPGEIIKKKLHDKGWTQRDLANILGRPLPKVNEIITGKTGLTPETAVKLAHAFGDTPEEWLLAEGRYRLSLVDGSDSAVAKRARLHEIAPVKEMERRAWIRKTTDPAELERELQEFFEADSLAEDPVLDALTRRSNGHISLNAAQRAWCFRARNLARLIPADEYDGRRFDKCLKQLCRLAAWPEEARNASRILAESGIRLVVIEPLARTRIDGAALWLNDKAPVVALSLRFDRIDSFWHTLGHELAHIRHRDGVQIDVDMVGESRPSPVELNTTELRADREAASMWIDSRVLDDFVLRVSPLYSKARINQFANRIKIHPGIIVGQLQHRGEISYASHRHALAKVRDVVTSTALTDGWGHTVERKG